MGLYYVAKKKRPLVKLVVSDLKDENPAVTFTSLVDHPAIESNWMAFDSHEYLPESLHEAMTYLLGLPINASASEINDRLKEEIDRLQSENKTIADHPASHMILIDALKAETDQEIDALRVLQKSAEKMSGFSSHELKVGDKVKVKSGSEHDPSHADMIMEIAEIVNGAIALKMPDGKIHKWYVADELEIADKQDFVAPQKGESESDFMKRCVPYMIEEGKEQDQAVAACMSMYKGGQQGFEFKVASEERRIITGAAMIPDKPIYRKDERGEYDVIFDKDTIEHVVKKWGKFEKHNKVNIMHSPDMKPDGVYLIESFIVDSKRGISAPKCLKEKFPDGTWIQSYYVENDAVWELVKQGKIKGFSVEGLFAMEEAFARFRKTEQDDNEKYLLELEAIAKKGTV